MYTYKTLNGPLSNLFISLLKTVHNSNCYNLQIILYTDPIIFKGRSDQF